MEQYFEFTVYITGWRSRWTEKVWARSKESAKNITQMKYPGYFVFVED